MILLSGFFYAAWTLHSRYNQMERERIREASMLALTLNPDRIRALHGDASDEQRPEYVRLQHQLKAALQISPNWEQIRLLSRKPDGALFYRLDTSGQHPPGAPNPEASPVLQQAFDSGVPTIEWRNRGRADERLCAYAPLFDEETGLILTVASLETDPRPWLHLRRSLLAVPAILTAALILLWIIGNGLLARRARLNAWNLRGYSYLETSMVLVAGLILTAGGAWSAHSYDTWQRQRNFERMHENELNLIIGRAHAFRDQGLKGLQSFIENSDVVTAAEFKQYTSHLVKNTAVLFWGWAPAVDAADRESFEQSARALTGNADYRIWSRNASGASAPARSDSRSYPILYLSSNQENTLTHGFDVGSDPTARAAIEEASVQRMVTSSEAESRPLPGNDEGGILVVEPVFSQPDLFHIKGFVIMGLDPRKWMTIRPFKNPSTHRLIIMDLYHVSPDHAPRWLACTGADDSDHSSHVFGDWQRIYSAYPLPLFGKEYVLVAHPGAGFHSAETSMQTVLVTIAGLLLTTGLTLLLAFYGRRRTVLYQQADEQSHALELSLRRYSQLEKQNRVITWEMNTEGLYVQISNMAEAILGYPPEDIIRKMHFYDFYPEANRERFKEEAFRLVSRGEPIRSYRNPMVCRSGEIIWVSTEAAPIRNAHGEVTGYWGTDTDITETKRTEDELAQIYQSNRDLVERYRALIKASRTGAWEFNPDPSKMWESTEYFTMLGLHPEDFDRSKHAFDLGKIWSDLLHPDDRDRAIKYFTDYVQNPVGVYEQIFRMRHADGRWIWILSRGEALRDDQGRLSGAVLGTQTDITAAKQAEEEIRESRRRYIALLANLPGMAYRCMNDRDWTMEFVSQRCLELTGYAPEDLINNRTFSYGRLIHPDFQEDVYNQWQQALDAGVSYEGEYKIRTRTGEEKWVWERGEGLLDPAGKVIALEGFIIDITSRKQAEFERERLVRVVEQSTETVVITDVNANIIYVNPAFCKATGYSREEALGKNPRILKSDQQGADFYRHLWDTLTSGQNWEGEFINRRKDGSLYTERASITPLRNASGKVVNYVAVKHDVTEERRSQEERAALQTQLYQAQKMESVGRLAGGVAHDFNNMLQAILGYTEIALAQTPADQPLRNDLEEIQKAARRSSDLTRQLQVFARKKSMAPQTIGINPAIEGMFGMLRRLIGESIHFEWAPGPNVGCITMDPGHLDQLLVNLVVNARDAVGPDGNIRIETSVVRLSPEEAHQMDMTSGGACVRLTVQDNGCGMSPDVIEHIFEPFFTTKPSGKGTGLGLATVYGIVRQTLGGIRVDSEPGKGTTFRVYLPQAEGEAPHEHPHEAPPKAAEPPASGTILLVDDEPSVLQSTRRILESLGYTVIATPSSEKALQLCKELRGKIDVLITDVIMPDLQGPDLVKRACKLSPGLRHLFISGYTAHLLEEQGIREDMAHVLSKPFTRDAMEERLRDVMGR